MCFRISMVISENTIVKVFKCDKSNLKISKTETQLDIKVVDTMKIDTNKGNFNFIYSIKNK